MKRTLLGLLIGCALGGSAVWYYQTHRGEPDVPAEGVEESAAGSFVRHETNGATVLKIDPEVQARMGLETAALEATTLVPEVKGYGRVLDPTPLSALVIETATARAALEASTREFQRLQVLVKTQNASARALEAAEAAMKRDELVLASTLPRLQLGWGQTIATRPDLPAFARSLVEQRAAVVRVDVPLSEAHKAAPSGGRLALLTAPDDFAEAEFLGAAPSADPQWQNQGFLFLQKTNPLSPGAAVVAWLRIPGGTQTGVTVPRAALVRQAGDVFLYRQTAADTFARQLVELDRPTDAGWFVREGFKPGEKVVIVGAQQLLSEELKGQGGGE